MPDTPAEKQRPRWEGSDRLPLLSVSHELHDALHWLAATWGVSVSEARRRCYQEAIVRTFAELAPDVTDGIPEAE